MIKSASTVEPSSKVTIVFVVSTSTTRLESLMIAGLPSPCDDVAILFNSLWNWMRWQATES